MRKKIGLFFGSFNPIHQGHLMIGNFMATRQELDEVWFVVSPHNPLKNKNSLANMYDRLEMVELAIEGEENLKSSSIEFNLPQPSYTIDTLTFLNEKHPQVDFFLIMGSDNLYTFQKWKNYELILENYKILIYPRPGFLGHPLEKHPSVSLTKTPLVEISSTFIRDSLKNKLSIRYFVPKEVIEFIDKKSLYL